MIENHQEKFLQFSATVAPSQGRHHHTLVSAESAKTPQWMTTQIASRKSLEKAVKQKCSGVLRWGRTPSTGASHLVLLKHVFPIANKSVACRTEDEQSETSQCLCKERKKECWAWSTNFRFFGRTFWDRVVKQWLQCCFTEKYDAIFGRTFWDGVALNVGFCCVWNLSQSPSSACGAGAERWAFHIKFHKIARHADNQSIVLYKLCEQFFEEE